MFSLQPATTGSAVASLRWNTMQIMHGAGDMVHLKNVEGTVECKTIKAVILYLYIH